MSKKSDNQLILNIKVTKNLKNFKFFNAKNLILSNIVYKFKLIRTGFGGKIAKKKKKEENNEVI